MGQNCVQLHLGFFRLKSDWHSVWLQSGWDRILLGIVGLGLKFFSLQSGWNVCGLEPGCHIILSGYIYNRLGQIFVEL